MINRRTIINVAWFGVISLVFLLWAGTSILSQYDPTSRPYKIQAEFVSAVSLLPGNEVAYLGVNYGKIKSVRRVPGGVRVSMEIKEGHRLPVGSTAHIFRKSAIGETYIDFAPPEGYQGGSGPFIKAGEVIPKERTTIPLEFSELLRAASRLVESIPPQDVTTVVHELATALRGRTDSLRELTVAGDRISQTLAARTEALDRLATNNTRLTRVFAEHRGSFGQALTDLRQVAETLRNAKGDLNLVLDRGASVLTQTADVVAKHKGNLDCDLKTLEAVIDETAKPPRLAGLRTVLTLGPRAFAGVFEASDLEPDGRWLRANLIANDENPPVQHVPPKTLPAVPSVAPCTSPLTPVQLDYTPARHRQTLPGPGVTSALGLGLSLIAAIAILRETRRNTST